MLRKKQQASAFTEAFLRALSGRVLSPETTSQIVNTQWSSQGRRISTRVRW